MFTSGPPSGTGPGGAGSSDHPAAPVAIRRVVRRAFPAPAISAADPEHRARLREYLSDLVRPYGSVLREDLFDRPIGQSYGEMAAAVAPAEPVDLVVLAYAVPDIRPGRATASYLSHILPGDPFAFAICDQGAAAAFTGLRLIGEYLRGGQRRALLIAVEQATLHYEPVAPTTIPNGHFAVAVLCESTGRARVTEVHQYPRVAREQAHAVLAGCAASTAILGAGLGSVDLVPDTRVRRASPGQPYTGVWWELAGELLAGDPSTERLLLADYDETLGYLCLSTIDIGRCADEVGRPAAGLGLGAAA